MGISFYAEFPNMPVAMEPYITALSQWSIGFSVFTVVLLLVVYWYVFKAFEKTWVSKYACTCMLVSLACLQVHHWLWFAHGHTLVDNSTYTILLYITAPSFYLFSRELLLAQSDIHPGLALHCLPALISPWLPAVVAIPLAFVLGGGYALWLCATVYRLKDQRERFHLELATFAAFAVVAIIILVTGLLTPIIGERWYVVSYSNFTAIALFAMLYLQMRFPDLHQKTGEAVAAQYAASTLKNEDCDGLVIKLKDLFEEQKIYRNENLSLSMLADALAISAHQTSELINTHFKVGFSRLLRSYRVDDAKQQLMQEPNASVLSIGLSVGFNSQSNFYTAFREITGMTPGQFRKQST